MGNRYFSDNHGLDEDALSRTLSCALEKGGDFAEVFAQHKVSDFVGFEDGQVNRAYVQVDLGAGIRVLKGDQTGYAYTESLSVETLVRAARTAASIASGAGTDFKGGFSSPSAPRLYSADRVWKEVLPRQKLGLVETVGAKVLSGDPSVVKGAVHFMDQDETILIANSEGLLVEDVRPMTYLFATCVAQKKQERQSNSYSVSARTGIDFYTDERLCEIAEETVRRTLVLFDAGSLPAGQMPVVLAPATSGILLHEAIGHGFEADFNRKEISIFSTMMGKKVAEAFVTIVDTALEPRARGSINVDDEGTVGQRTVLVENGILSSYLHDRISAAHFEVQPTGNGRREDFRCPPLPRMRVTTMENGPHDPQEIIESVDKGLYAVDFSNGEVAIGAGDYSFYVKTGYLIEGGKLTRPVKDANLIGNGPDSLAKMTMVGNDKALDTGTWTCGKDGQGVPVGLGLPTVKVSSITVGGLS